MKVLLFMALAIVALVIGASPALADLSAINPADLSAELSALVGFAMAGMIINKETLAELTRNIKTSFQKVFDSVAGGYKETTMVVPSTGSENDYKWLTSWPAMREWIGEKVINALKANKYVVPNKDYEATIEVDRNDLEDGALSGAVIQAKMTGESAAEHYDNLDATLKSDGFVNKCYDGQFYYDTDHPVDDSNGIPVSVSNKGTAVLSSANLAAAEASIGAAILAISTFKRDGGGPLGVIPNILEVPPQLKVVAKRLMGNDKLGDNSENPFKGELTVIVNPRLTSSTAWFVHCTTKVAKPFIIQERKKPMFVSLDQGDNVFMRKKFLYSIEARTAGAYGFWQLSYGSDGTG